MSNKWIYMGLPLSMFFAYILGMLIYPNPSPIFCRFVLSELGIIENATAAFFMVAAIFGLILFFKSKNLAPKSIRFIYIILFIGGTFVALEETNYGQFYYNYRTGEWFSKGKVEDFNLHNLAGNMPARRMNLIATLGFPMVCIVLPLIGLKKGWFNPGHWGFYLLPKEELILMAILAQISTWFDDIYIFLDVPLNAWARATEFKELYWALILTSYGIILNQRLKSLKKAKDQTGNIVCQAK